MKRLIAGILAIGLVMISLTAFAYGKILTSNGYYVEDGCSFTRREALCFCSASAAVWHSETDAYKRHYSTATINKESRYGTTIASSGRQWCSSSSLTSYANCQAQNAAIYGGYGWWGGVY